MNAEVGRAAELLSHATHGVALTGAGVSTRSGIPDFRTPGTGLWSKVDPAQIASIDAFMRDPQAYYRWRRPLLTSLRQVEPNPAHRALAELEQRDILRALITQNIDGLHQRAGSRRVLEVHGAAHEVICLSCRQIFREDGAIWRIIDKGDVPYCPQCGGLLKPNIVLFGEALPFGVLRQVEQEIAACDLILVVGSSLAVQPACWWPDEAVRHGAQAVVVNLTETYLDDRAAVVIRGDVAEVLPAIVEAIGRA